MKYLAVLFVALMGLSLTQLSPSAEPVQGEKHSPVYGSITEIGDDIFQLTDIDATDPKKLKYTLRKGLTDNQTITMNEDFARLLDWKPRPTFNMMINGAEVEAFLHSGGPPPSWQWNGKSWDFTGGKYITAAYWQQLQSAYTLTPKPKP